jgi:hypothetical protein
MDRPRAWWDVTDIRRSFYKNSFEIQEIRPQVPIPVELCFSQLTHSKQHSRSRKIKSLSSSQILHPDVAAAVISPSLSLSYDRHSAQGPYSFKAVRKRTEPNTPPVSRLFFQGRTVQLVTNSSITSDSGNAPVRNKIRLQHIDSSRLLQNGVEVPE